MSARRRVAVYGLVVLATLLLIASSLTVFAKRQLLNTDAWTKSSAQVLADPEVRAALSTKLVDLLYQRVDVAAQLEKALPPRAQAAAPAIAAGLQTAAVRAVNTLLSTARAQQAWENANRRAHTALVKVLEGKPVRGLSTSNGAVVLDLRPLLDRISARIGIVGKARANAPPNAGEIVLLRSDQLKAAQDAVRVFKALTIFLLIVVLALYALAVYLAHGRRRVVLEVSGASLVFSGLVLIVVRRLVGNAIVDSLVHTEANKVPVHHVWLIETQILGDIGIALFVYGLLVLIAGWLGGPMRPAVAIRRFLAPTFRDRPFVVYGVAAAALLIVIAWGPTNATRQLIGIAVLAGLLGLGIEVWRRQTLREFPAVGAEPAPAEEPPAESQKPALT
jgi:hypothetical protein